MAIIKLGSIPKETATATPALQPMSAFFEYPGIPRSYN